LETGRLKKKRKPWSHQKKKKEKEEGEKKEKEKKAGFARPGSVFCF
jgi:hypothetical protein